MTGPLKHFPGAFAAAVLCAALVMGGAAAADAQSTGNDNSPPELPDVNIAVELCVGEPASCYDLPTSNSVSSGSAKLTVECVNTGDDDDCADIPFDKASVGHTVKDLVDASASFDLDPLTAGETRSVAVSIRSSTHERRWSVHTHFNIAVQN